ncbi:MAG: hypothetical protein SGCHY_003946, partial [Lobulomycetales sp.]
MSVNGSVKKTQQPATMSYAATAKSQQQPAKSWNSVAATQAAGTMATTATQDPVKMPVQAGLSQKRSIVFGSTQEAAGKSAAMSVATAAAPGTLVPASKPSSASPSTQKLSFGSIVKGSSPSTPDAMAQQGQAPQQQQQHQHHKVQHEKKHGGKNNNFQQQQQHPQQMNYYAPNPMGAAAMQPHPHYQYAAGYTGFQPQQQQYMGSDYNYPPQIQPMHQQQQQPYTTYNSMSHMGQPMPPQQYQGQPGGWNPALARPANQRFSPTPPSPAKIQAPGAATDTKPTAIPIPLKPAASKAIKIVNPLTLKEVKVEKTQAVVEKEEEIKRAAEAAVKAAAAAKLKSDEPAVRAKTPDVKEVAAKQSNVEKNAPVAVKPEQAAKPRATPIRQGIQIRDPASNEIVFLGSKSSERTKMREDFLRYKEILDKKLKSKIPDVTAADVPKLAPKATMEKDSAPLPSTPKAVAEKPSSPLPQKTAEVKKAVPVVPSKTAEVKKAEPVVPQKTAKVEKAQPVAPPPEKKQGETAKPPAVADKNPTPAPAAVVVPAVTKDVQPTNVMKQPEAEAPSSRRTGSPERSSKPRVETSPVKRSAPVSVVPAKIIESTMDLTYPSNIANPNVDRAKGPIRYTREFLIAMRPLCKTKPDEFVSVQDLINETSGASPRPEKRPSMDRSGGSGRGMQRQSSSGGRYGLLSLRLMVHRYERDSFSGTKGMDRIGSDRGDRRRSSRRGGGRGDDDWDRRGGNRSMPQTPLEDFEPLKTTENAWKPKHLATKASAAAAVSSDDVDARVADLKKKITATLNKLAPERFERLSDDILNLDVSDPDLLGALLEKIFDKALSEAHYATMYAQLCYKLCDKLPLLQPWMQEAPDNKNNKFRRGLLLKCQQEFEAGKNWAVEEAEAREQAKKGAENMTLEEREAFLAAGEKRIKSKIRSLGNIRFVGELFKLRIITEKVMHACVKSLLTNVTDPEEESVESLCKLMSTIGSYLDTQTAVDHMTTYFDRIAILAKNEVLPSRIRFMLLDLIDMRNAGWRDRKGATGRKKLAEVRKDSEAKAAAASKKMDVRSGSSRGPERGGSRRENMPTMREQLRGDRMSSGARGRMSQDSRSFDRAAPQGPDGWSISGGSARSSPKMERKGSSRGSLSRPASPAQREQKAPSKEATKNMFELLESPSSAAASPVTAGTSPETMEAPKSASKETPKVLSEEEKNLRVPSAVNEWFCIFDMT